MENEASKKIKKFLFKGYFIYSSIVLVVSLFLSFSFIFLCESTLIEANLVIAIIAGVITFGKNIAMDNCDEIVLRLGELSFKNKVNISC